MTREQLELSIKANMPTNGVGYITAAHTRQVAEDMADYVDTEVGGCVQEDELSTVATTGNYSDLNNKPTIPDTTYMVTGSITGIRIEVVTEMPATPEENTIYIVQQQLP
jgi:hypothetical protein